MRIKAILLAIFFFTPQLFSAQIYRCSGSVFTDHGCANSEPVQLKQPAVIYDGTVVLRELEQSLRAMAKSVAKSKPKNFVQNASECTNLASQLDELRAYRRHGYRASEESALDKKKAALTQKQKESCDSLRMRGVRGNHATRN